jgi:hypothetical protein
MKGSQRLRQQGVEKTVEKTDTHDMMTSVHNAQSFIVNCIATFASSKRTV